MKLKIREICNTDRTDYKNKVLREWNIEKPTEEECFIEAYAEVRHLRYCNGYWVEFVEPEVQKKFMEWRKTGVTMEMYYGGGVVD